MLNSDLDLNELTRKIAGSVPIHGDARRRYLKSRLRDLQNLSTLLQSAKVAETPSRRAKTFESIERACATILKVFGVDDGNIDLDRAFEPRSLAPILAFQIAEIINPRRTKHSPLEDPISRAKLVEVLHGMRLLRDAVTRARRQAEEQKQAGRGGARREPDWRVREFAKHALCTYYDVTGRKPGTSRPASRGERSGPAVRFLDILLSAMNWRVKRSTAADLIDDYKNDPEMPWNMGARPKFKH